MFTFAVPILISMGCRACKRPTDAADMLKRRDFQAKLRKVPPADSLRGMVQHANPLMLGSVANKAVAADFWKWAQAGNVQPAQLQEFRDLMNTYQKTMFAAGLSRERFEVPEKGAPITRIIPARVSLVTIKWTFRAHFCYSAPVETHAFGFRLRANAPEGQKRFPISISSPGLGRTWAPRRRPAGL